MYSDPSSVMARIERQTTFVPECGCHLWTGVVSDKGYARITFTSGNQKRYRAAHRVAYEIARGPIPNGLCLDHRCRVRSCVNPDHLEPVTNKENVLRGVGITAAFARKTHCPAGHEYSEENTRYHGGSRHCRTCDRERDRARGAALAKAEGRR